MSVDPSWTGLYFPERATATLEAKVPSFWPLASAICQMWLLWINRSIVRKDILATGPKTVYPASLLAIVVLSPLSNCCRRRRPLRRLPAPLWTLCGPSSPGQSAERKLGKKNSRFASVLGSKSRFSSRPEKTASVCAERGFGLLKHRRNIVDVCLTQHELDWV